MNNDDKTPAERGHEIESQNGGGDGAYYTPAPILALANRGLVIYDPTFPAALPFGLIERDAIVSNPPYQSKP